MDILAITTRSSMVITYSSPYYVNSNRVMDPTMGVPSSAGCVRLEIQNAKWIYDNIPYGTKVVTY